MSHPSDLVKGLDGHIHVVYFAVMGLALLLLAASLTTPARTDQKPIRDLQAIIHLREGEGKLEQRVEVGITKSVARLIRNREQEYQTGQPITIAVQNGRATSFFKIRCESA